MGQLCIRQILTVVVSPIAKLKIDDSNKGCNVECIHGSYLLCMCEQINEKTSDPSKGQVHTSDMVRLKALPSQVKSVGH